MALFTVRRTCEDSRACSQAAEIEFSYVVGGDAQGNALGEDAHVIAENSNACTGGAWVSQGGAVSEVVGGRLIEGPKEGEELPVFHISLA